MMAPVRSIGAAHVRRPSFRWCPFLLGRLRSALLAFALAAVPVTAQAQDIFRLKPIDRVALRAVMASVDEGDFGAARTRAARSRDGSLIDLVTWFTLTDRENHAGFSVLSRFIDEHENWPGQGGLMLRAEQALPGDLSPRALVGWFTAHPPVSGNGLLVYLTALKERGRTSDVHAILQDRWPSVSTTPVIERRLRQRFADHIDEALDFRRLDRLLLERRSVEAKRTAGHMGRDYSLLTTARIVLADNSGGADAALANVPGHLMDDPGLTLQRATWRRTRGRAADAAELLLDPVADVSRPDLWWRERRIIARELFDEQAYKTAYQVIEAGAAQAPGGTDWAQAEFFAGWLALVHLDDRAGAARHFRRLYSHAQTPVSKARGAYWLGRALSAHGGAADEAERWYAIAAGFPWVYYGQRAVDRLGTPLDLPAPPPLSAGVAKRFSRNSAVRLVEGLTAVGRPALATRFFYSLIGNAESPIALNAAATLAHSLGRSDMVVVAAREASQRGFALIPAGHPMPNYPERLTGDPLSLAIIRQESQFKPNAHSSAGAVGLMQIMPATAKQMAKRIGLPYDRARLGRDVDYNVSLGGAILDAAIERYEGRLALVAAAYNAGGTQLSRWLRANGDPGIDADEMDNFIEAIPFPETRNYVHRVLENERIYRELLTRSDRLEAAR